MKLAVICHSESGNTMKAAGFIKNGMELVPGTEVSVYSIEEAASADLSDVKGVVFGAPTYYAQVSWQMFRFLETEKTGFANKLGAAFSTANVEQGGSELVLQNLIMVMLAKGMLVYSGGTSHGQPFTHIGANAFAKASTIEAREELLTAFGKRFAEKAAELFR